MYRLRIPVRSADLAACLGLDHRGSEVAVEGVTSSGGALNGALCFVKAGGAFDAGSARVAVISAVVTPGEGARIISPNPRLDFIRALLFLEETCGFESSSDAPVVHPTAVVGSGVVLEPGVQIGERSIIEPNVTVHRGVRIGKRCRVRSGASLGSEGFGYERDAAGRPLRFVHLGSVIIEDDVEVGSCTTIARGTLGDTIIRCGAKIDNLVHVAHNVIVEEGAFIIAGAELSGGVRVGRNAWIGPNACVLQKVTIGEMATVGLGAVVVRDVAGGATVAGNPAETTDSLRKTRAALRKLVDPQEP